MGARNDDVKKLVELCRRGVNAPGPIVLLEGGPCCTMPVVESGRVALEANLQTGRAKEKTATIDVIAQGGWPRASRLLEPHIPTPTGGTLETAKVNTLDAKELEGLLEESP